MINIPLKIININIIKTNGEELNNSNSKNNCKCYEDISKKGIDSSISKKNIGNNRNINKKIIYFNDYELNILSYDDAIKYDKRNFFQFYFFLLKTNQVIIFTFFNHNDYNSKIIKIYLFLFSFALYFTVNGLFFDDQTMHKIYKDGGKYDFIYQMPITIYSSLICAVIITLIKFLSLSQKNILEIKNLENIEELQQKVDNILNCLKIKFKLFFILTFSLSVLFWYYLGCFCSVYTNTQIHLIKDTLMSFVFSSLYPLGLYLIPGIFRIISLNKNIKLLYQISKIIQFI